MTVFSQLNIRSALEKRIELLTPEIAIAYEGKPYTPVVNVPYQRLNLLSADPDNPTMGDGYYRDIGIFQITLFYPNNKALREVIERAEATRKWFKRGMRFVKDGQEVLITRTPAIAPAMRVDDRISVPISIPYQSEVFS